MAEYWVNVDRLTSATFTIRSSRDRAATEGVVHHGLRAASTSRLSLMRRLAALRRDRRSRRASVSRPGLPKPRQQRRRGFEASCYSWPSRDIHQLIQKMTYIIRNNVRIVV